jgi:hypothetical protein
MIQFNHSSFTQNKVWTEARDQMNKSQLTLKRRQLNVMNFTCSATVYTLSVPIILLAIKNFIKVFLFHQRMHYIFV